MTACFSRFRKAKRVYKAESIEVGPQEVCFKVAGGSGSLSTSKETRSVRILLEGVDGSGETDPYPSDSLEVVQDQRSVTILVGDRISVRMTYSPWQVTVYYKNEKEEKEEEDTCLCTCRLKTIKKIHILVTEIKDAHVHLYGLAERASSSELTNGRKYRMYNTDEFGLAQGTDKPLYGSVPFLLAVSSIIHGSVGLLLRNTSETEIRLKKVGWKGLHRQYWSHERGSTDLVIITGKEALEVRQNLIRLSGHTDLPPIFSLGYHQCRWNYNDQEDVLKVDTCLREAEIPCDVIWLDIEHTNGKRYFTWDEEKFDPQVLIKRLKINGRHLVVIVDPHIKEDAEYDIYQEAKEAGYLVKDEDGSIFVGDCWPGSCVWVDFLNEKASSWWSEKVCQYLTKYGSYDGSCNNLWLWNDMNEPSVFKSVGNQMRKTALHVDEVQHGQIHNIYGQRMAKASWEGIKKATEGKLRPLLLSRSFYTGSQRYGAIWTGDSVCSWDHLRVSVSMMLSISLCGIDFCGADVGGFFGDPSPELLCRWYQFGAFQPFFRAHAHIESKRREPYLVEEPFKQAIRNAICFRYKLLSYWYLCFWRAETLFLPVVAPIWMIFSGYQSRINDEAYMIGDTILVQPILSSSCHSMSLLLPGTSKDIWYQFCQVSSLWQVRKAAVRLQIAVNIESIPIFYRSGSVIFIKEGKCSNTEEWKAGPYDMFIFPSVQGCASGMLYVDDGQSVGYKSDDQYSLYKCTFDTKSRESTIVQMECVHPFREGPPHQDYISTVTIIKNEGCGSMDWSQVLCQRSDHDILISHFQDRVHITNVGLDFSQPWTLSLK